MKKLLAWIRGLFTKKQEPPAAPAVPTPAAPVRKPPKKGGVKLRKCFTTDKYMYTREQAVDQRDRLRNRTPNGYLRIYLCEFCEHWHLTHKRAYKN